MDGSIATVERRISPLENTVTYTGSDVYHLVFLEGGLYRLAGGDPGPYGEELTAEEYTDFKAAHNVLRVVMSDENHSQA